MILSGYLIMLAGFISYLPWGPGYPKIGMKAKGIDLIVFNALKVPNVQISDERT